MRRKEEKGSVTLFVLISCMFMVVILLIVNIGVMNKNRSQEKNLEEIAKQYNQNETDLDNVYNETMNKQEYITKQELEDIISVKVEEERKKNMYNPGDTVLTGYTGGGNVTSSGTEYFFAIQLGKIISEEVETIEIESIENFVVRQNNNYLFGDPYEMINEGFTIKVGKFYKNSNVINLHFRVPNKHDKVINNDAVGIVVTNLKLKFN